MSKNKKEIEEQALPTTPRNIITILDLDRRNSSTQFGKCNNDNTTIHNIHSIEPFYEDTTKEFNLPAYAEYANSMADNTIPGLNENEKLEFFVANSAYVPSLNSSANVMFIPNILYETLPHVEDLILADTLLDERLEKENDIITKTISNIALRGVTDICNSYSDKISQESRKIALVLNELFINICTQNINMDDIEYCDNRSKIATNGNINSKSHSLLYNVFDIDTIERCITETLSLTIFKNIESIMFVTSTKADQDGSVSSYIESFVVNPIIANIYDIFDSTVVRLVSYVISHRANKNNTEISDGEVSTAELMHEAVMSKLSIYLCNNIKKRLLEMVMRLRLEFSMASVEPLSVVCKKIGDIYTKEGLPNSFAGYKYKFKKSPLISGTTEDTFRDF